MLALIICKHAKHNTQKELIDSKAHMVSIVQFWDKIVKELQKRKWKTKHQKTTSCAKINGIHLTLTRRNLHIIIKGHEIIPICRIWCPKKRNEVICLLNSTKSIMILLKPFKGRGLWIFLCIPRMWMFNEMEFTNHQHRKHIMKIKIICNHRKCQNVQNANVNN